MSSNESDQSSWIPIVDFSAMSLAHKELPCGNDRAMKELTRRMVNAFSTVGFVYLTGHGMPQETIDSAFQAADKLFSLSTHMKEKYSKSAGADANGWNGWDALERESSNPEMPGDLKESYDLTYFLEDDFLWPDAVVPGFKKPVMTFQRQAHQLSLRVLTAIAIGLDLDPHSFHYAFKHTGTREGGTQIRFNYYPELQDTKKVKPGQIRCGEHTDYGAITLLFQDEIGGLEVMTSEGSFMPAPPIKGSIVVNIADIMQRWTSDRLLSARHRVVIQDKEVTYLQPRRSIVYFLQADRDALVECLDGSAKYPAITGGQYLWQKFDSTYNF